MPRKGRVVIPHQAHHVTQRGNNRQNVFETEEDFSAYCFFMNKYAFVYKVHILAYCLMNNHVHFVAEPEERQSLAGLFRTVHMRYAQYKNYKESMSGHLWQGRFFSCVLGQSHLYNTIRYVEQNPVRAHMVARPWDYAWSSARFHVRQFSKKYIKIKNTTIVDKNKWKTYLMNSDPAIDAEIRRKTLKGKALADQAFIKYWEEKLNCLLRELKPGRKVG